MKTRITRTLLVAALLLGATFSRPALAEVINFHTGIHHWVKTCGPFADGSWTQEYVGQSSCPPLAVLPPNCSCNLTPYDFPVDNPYPYLIRVQTGVSLDNTGKPDGSGNVNVTVDSSQAIQCGVTVIPAPDDQSVCGAPWTVVPADPSQIDPNLLQIVQGLVPNIEQQTGVPVQSFTWWTALPQN